jgi:glycosyltransferase involved in cell wall biosynthesis
MIRICTTLSAEGYDVLLVGRQRQASRPLEHRPFRQKRLYCFFEHGKFFYAEYNLRLLFFLLFSRFHALCAVDLDTLLPAFLIAKLKNKPCIYDAHEYFTEVPEVNRRPAVKKMWEALADVLIPKIKYAYTVGPCLAKIFEERYGTPFEVIRNMPFKYPIPSSQDTPPSQKVILYQGALNEGRGLEAAIMAMHEIHHAELWLAGEGDLSDKLRKMVEEEGLQTKVTFLGYLLPAALKELTPKAYIGLNLLENKGLSYYYSLANKAFDYIQAGVPSIHMAFPEYQQLNDTYATFVLIPDLEPDHIKFAIQQLIEEEDTYLSIRNHCLQAAQHLNWEEESRRLVSFYKSIFKSNNNQTIF